MQIGSAGLSLIKESEGYREHVYKDAAGLPTIGYGHKLAEGESFPCGISESDAEKLLVRDVAWAERSVSKYVWVPLNQNQFDALVDFTYNLGAGTLFRSTLLMLLNGGKYEAVPAELLRYNHFGQTVSPGLTRRREAEVALWNANPASTEIA